MFKNQNVFRDFLFALALIALIRLVYQQHAEIALHKTKKSIIKQELSPLDTMLKTTALALEQAITVAQAEKNQLLRHELQELKKQWQSINQQYNQKIKQEDAITYLLGPLYSISKVAKEHVLKKRLSTIKETLDQIMQQGYRPPEKTSSYIATAHL